MLLPDDKASYRSVNCGTATALCPGLKPWAHQPVLSQKNELLEDNILLIFVWFLLLLFFGVFWFVVVGVFWGGRMGFFCWYLVNSYLVFTASAE